MRCAAGPELSLNRASHSLSYILTWIGAGSGSARIDRSTADTKDHAENKMKTVITATNVASLMSSNLSQHAARCSFCTTLKAQPGLRARRKYASHHE